MATIKSIQKRIKSAKSISQITKAMQMVAAARMKKAQDQAIQGKPYQEKIAEAVVELAKRVDPEAHRLLTHGSNSEKKLVILISTNKGLCGGLNTTLMRNVTKWFQPDQCDFITLGKKGQRFVSRSNRTLYADFTSDNFLEKAQPITELFIDKFISGEYGKVYLVFNRFISSLKQEPVFRQILPIALEDNQTNENKDILWNEFLIEPRRDEVLNALLPHYVETQVRTAIFESIASEHSARMMAMKNATDNAHSLIDNLTLTYNSLRQEKITYEIADIVTARISVE